MKQIKTRQQLSQRIIFGLFAVLLVLEPISKLFHLYDFNLRLKAIVKIFLLVTLLVLTATVKVKRELIYILIAITVSFFVGQFVLTKEFSIFGNNLLSETYNGDIYIFTKYIYVIIFVLGFIRISNHQDFASRLIKLFNGFMVVNTVFIIIGVFTELNFFKSYPDSERFGYQGLIELAGESIHFYIIAISLAYVNYLYTKKYLLLLFFIIGGVLLGKKAIFLYLLMLILVNLLYHKKKFLLYLIASVVLLLIVFNKIFIEIFIEFFPFWKELYIEHGFKTVIFSTRDILFSRSIDYIINFWEPLNYIFGGVDFFNYRSEFGFFDLYLTLGAFGVAVYLLFIYKYFYKNQLRVVKTLVGCIFITEAFSGGLLINVMPMVILYLVSVKLSNYRIIEKNKFETQDRFNLSKLCQE